MSIRILLADDHTLMRKGLRELVSKHIGMDVVGEAGSGTETVRLAQELAPDVVVMDISMPDLNGIEATRQICGRNPRIRVLALSMHADARYVTEMLRAGAAGYLLKDAAADELIRAIMAVSRLQTYLSPAVAGVVVERCVRRVLADGAGSAFSVLSDRERQILQLLAEGKSTKEIAAFLGRSVKTVECHRHNIMVKLKLHSLPELTKYAVREGVTGLER
jgi:DNA-binding NarL/FixJ family response regulator